MLFSYLTCAINPIFLKYNNVSILLNSGTGSFTFAGNYNAGVAPNSINSTTLDGNGSQDLVVTNINGMVTLLNTNTAP